MKAYRRTKQARRRRPNRTGARPPSPEYHIGDRHKRSHWAKQETGVDYFIAYHARGPRVSRHLDPMHMHISGALDLFDGDGNPPPWLRDDDDGQTPPL